MLVETYTNLISEQVYKECIKNECDENSYLGLIETLIAGINPKHAPTPTAVRMNVKRRLWHLSK